MKSIAIIGLGQIGGSMALALRSAQPDLRITGVDISKRRLRLLESTLDASSSNWKDADGADLAILCLHFDETMDLLRRIPPDLLCMDVCSAKQTVVTLANRRQLNFIGGHPMTGNERRGEKGWDAGMFRDHPFFLCPTGAVVRQDVAKVKRLLRKLHAKCVEVDPAEHDRFVAISSHLPALISLAYRAFTRDLPEVYKGPGYHSFTRLAATSPELLDTFLSANRSNIESIRRRWDRYWRQVE